MTKVNTQSRIEISEDLIRRFDSLGPRYTSYPTADRFQADFNASAYLAALDKRRATNGSFAANNAGSEPAPLSVYIHIPFCSSLCYYCACNKVITKDRSKSTVYLQYLQKELQLIRPHLSQRESISQLHLGGGTPTFLNDDELSFLMLMLRRKFDFTTDAEISIEIDPRTVNRETLALLRELGFNRISLGVQDFDDDVQKAIHRLQPYEMVERTVLDSRELGFGSTNFDLIYGLPKQTIDSFSRTLDRVLTLSPERIALYNYAHLPTRFKAQRRIAEQDLPTAEQRLQIFLMSLQRLLAAGYVYIGLDHFAKPSDSLALAALDQSLHRNFQGYTTRAECDLIALGVSAIGKIGDAYVQNYRDLKDYYAALDENRLPVEKGLQLNQDDVLRKEVIMSLMCSQPLDFKQIERDYHINFHEYFAPELAQIKTYAESGLIDLDQSGVRVTPKGRLFVRAVGMAFDRYLAQRTQANYSRLI
jgi:oxygen-independent coproporphyrinogen-3 oxidase